MGLLQTWGQYSTYVDAQGKYRIWWQWEDGSVTNHKFDAFIPEVELQAVMDNIKRNWDYGWIPKLSTKLDDDETLIKNAVLQIRTHPNLTLAQYNTYLATLQWYDAVVIRAFIYKLALLLAQHYDIQLSNYTEAEILQKTRNWIVGANINVLKKVVFGYFIEL